MQAIGTDRASLGDLEAPLDSDLAVARRAVAEVPNVSFSIRHDTEHGLQARGFMSIALPDEAVAEHATRIGAWAYEPRALDVAHRLENGNAQLGSLAQVVVEIVAKATKDGVAVLDPAEELGADGLVEVVVYVRFVVRKDGCLHWVLVRLLVGLILWV